MKLQKIRLLIIGLGFFWIFFATTLGGLVGAKINNAIIHADNSHWLQGFEKTLLVSAHTHINLMSVVSVLLALSLSLIWNRQESSQRFIRSVIWTNLVSMNVFGLGLIVKAFFIHSVFLTSIIALASILYIISTACFASLFLYRCYQS